MNAHQQIFEKIHDTVTADTGSGGLAASSGTDDARLVGSVIRHAERRLARGLPRAEVLFPSVGRVDAFDSELSNVAVRVMIFCDRDRAYGTGDTPEEEGQLALIRDRFEALFDAVTLTLDSGTASKMDLVREYEGPSSDTTVGWVMEFTVYVCP